MSVQCTIQIVNYTSDYLFGNVDHQYQMDLWSFGKVPAKNYNTYGVRFYSGSFDEDDGAEATFSNSTGNIWQLQARTDEESVHSLQVEVLGNADTFVIASSGTGSITSAIDPTSVSWNPLNTEQGTLSLDNIGFDGQFKGLGLVDLSLLLDPATALVYLDAIKTGTLNYTQQQALLNTLKKAYGMGLKVPA